MGKNLPPRRYSFSGVVLVVVYLWRDLAVESSVQWLDVDFVFMALTVFIGGMVFADVLNPVSKLRGWLSGLVRAFDVHLITPHHVDDKEEWITLNLRIEMTKSISRCRLVGRVYAGIGLSHTQANLPLFSEDGPFEAGYRKFIDIATLPIRSAAPPIRNQEWIADGPSMLGSGSENIVEIQLKHFFWTVQTERFLVSVNHPYGAHEFGKAFIVHGSIDEKLEALK